MYRPPYIKRSPCFLFIASISSPTFPYYNSLSSSSPFSSLPKRSMASISVPCPKTSAPLHLHSKQTQVTGTHSSLSFRPDSNSNRALLAGSSSNKYPVLSFQAINKNQYEVLRASSQLNAETMPEESAKKDTIPDAASISAFINQVADLIGFVDSKDIMELSLKQENCEVLIRKKEALPQPAAAPYVMMQSPPQAAAPQLPPAAAPTAPPPALAAPPAAKPKSSHPPLKSPMAGTFYRCPAPGAPPFIKVGDEVQKGQAICIIEAMKLMNEIEADHAGTVVDILVDDATPVSVDVPLMIIEP